MSDAPHCGAIITDMFILCMHTDTCTLDKQRCWAGESCCRMWIGLQALEFVAKHICCMRQFEDIMLGSKDASYRGYDGDREWYPDSNGTCTTVHVSHVCIKADMGT